MPVAFRKETFRVKLVSHREVSGPRLRGRVLPRYNSGPAECGRVLPPAGGPATKRTKIGRFRTVLLL